MPSPHLLCKQKRKFNTILYTARILKLGNVLKISTPVHKLQCPKKGTPAVLSKMILPASKVHNYNTRYATNLNTYRLASRTNYGLARFKVIASKIWETIPTEMKCLSHIFQLFQERYIVEKRFLFK